MIIFNQSVIKGTLYAIDIEIEDRTTFNVGNLEITPRVAAMAASLLDLAGISATLKLVSCLAVEPGTVYSRWINTVKLRFLYELDHEQQTSPKDNESEPWIISLP